MMPPTLLVHVFRFNSINKITDKSLAGLRKLELLLVHGNDIHSLPDGAFRDLSSLQVGEAHHKKCHQGDPIRGPVSNCVHVLLILTK